MNKMIEEIKTINPKSICLYKDGTFYHVYGRDAVIMSCLFNYSIKEIGENHKECGFPIGALSKVVAKLQNLEINYLLIDRRNNYDVDEKEDYKVYLRFWPKWFASLLTKIYKNSEKSNEKDKTKENSG